VPESKVISLDERAKEEQKPFLEQLLREGARKLLQAAIENEVIDYIQFHSVMLRRQEYADAAPILAYLVTPLGPLPAPPARPASIYGHLPFGTTTASDTVIYRWEAFPTSRRITRTTGGGTIAADTYAAPASEMPFAPTGFSAVARFALPNLLPACFRWELQPLANTPIECGAAVPLYGQSGGGVEVKFPSSTTNRCPIADAVLLPAM
jgi:hypothetical protein